MHRVFVACALVAVAVGCSDSSPTAPAPAVPTTIELSAPSITLVSIGQSINIQATVKDQYAAALTDRIVVWSSTNPAVAFVSGTGDVVAVSVGTANIKATVGTATATIPVTVRQDAATITLGNTAPVLSAINDTVSLVATVRDAGGRVIAVSDVQWTSATTAVASVTSTGNVKAVANGTSVVTARVGNLSATATVRVAQAVAQVRVSSSAVSFNSIGDTIRLVATAFDRNNVGIANPDVRWASLGFAVTTTSTGLLTAAVEGQSNVTATVGTEFAIVTATVKQKAARVIVAPNPLAFSALTETFLATARVEDANGNVMLTDVTWSSAAPAIARVSAAGVITAVTNGNTTISATTGNVSGSLTVNVQQVASTVTVAPASTTIQVGKTQQLFTVVKDKFGNQMSGVTLTWATLSPLVAGVSQSGLISALTTGTAVVSVSLGNITELITIYVIP